MYVIFIDSGTTNTRIRLVEEEKTIVLDVEKVQVGVRNTAIDGNNQQLKKIFAYWLRSGIATKSVTSRRY